jgi:periplasmic divalent cation tolerance protein
MDKIEIIEVQVTYPDEASALKAADHLIRKQLAACVNFAPIQSIYWWKNEIQHDDEYLALFKTGAICLEKLLSEIKNIHPYGVPAILYWKVYSTPEYAQWVEEVVNPENTGS